MGGALSVSGATNSDVVHIAKGRAVRSPTAVTNRGSLANPTM